ncbi:DUF934 domain-containing protein [Paraburkholderia rhizosphaerae]|uniref:Uncharacterized protein DUF934 n=1 Tax=Paraburkholderia rhizosphaerae TaxID=480658 RepID=A0A4R8L7Y5_9BURK|nr:DUF934 domain-containing protein [Paraburkholderia rhizosphaerae]TDY38823.1 uncharacterized protein DUF934 [Paraburkholderia rhizosphaerae]
MNGVSRIRLLTAACHASNAEQVERVVSLANDIDPLTQRDAIAAAQRVELHFPSFTDGRAYSQAYLIRRRLGFAGDLRATGDVLADQLAQMERTGFSSAVLSDDVDVDDAQRQLQRFAAFYQGDAAHDAPFRRTEPERR